MLRPLVRIKTSCWALFALLVAVFSACADNAPGSSGALVDRLNVEFRRTRVAHAELPDTTVRQDPYFGASWPATFAPAADGSLLARPEPRPGSQVRIAGLTTRFPENARGEIRIELGPGGRAWLSERLVGASPLSSAAVVAGRVVYAGAGAMRGVDRIYEVSPQRVEEYLRLADPGAAVELLYEVETGADILDIVVDGAGSGLVVLGAEWRAVLKAPQPRGVDARGQPVMGRLVPTRIGAHRFTIRVELLTDSPGFPVLLDPSWVSTGLMSAARSLHSATLLPSGKVLVAGGEPDPPPALASAELFDPDAGTWLATGNMPTPSFEHTATLLPNGLVLVAGGFKYFVPIASAKLYDPASGTWSPTADLATARFCHSATLLPNGKVLVAGGSTGGSPAAPTASCELYDPPNGTWSATGAMLTARYGHAVALLPDGKVLVAGGVAPGNSGALATAELYDPSTGTWSATGSMDAGTRYQTATLLLNGKVLVTATSPETAYPVPHRSELYDMATRSWSSTELTNAARFGHAATLLPNGGVLIAGGYYWANGPRLDPGAVELFDPALNSWSTTNPLSVWRNAPTATLLPSGSVLLAGGKTGDVPLDTAEIFTLDSPGRPCRMGITCASGFCDDGVCCLSHCGGCGTCNSLGAAGTCVLADAGITCRAAVATPDAGSCDLAETCDGISAVCPVDVFAPTTTVCRPATEICDVADRCSGASADCPDEVQPSTITCRAAAGFCDLDEKCVGVAPFKACPPDRLVDAGVVCRLIGGVCDREEVCTGVSRNCPIDARAPDGVTCPDGTCAGGVCIAGGGTRDGGGTGGDSGAGTGGGSPGSDVDSGSPDAGGGVVPRRGCGCATDSSLVWVGALLALRPRRVEQRR